MSTQKGNTPIPLIEPLWERQKGESTEWYRRFCRVRNQIGKRSLLAAVRYEAEESGKQRKIPRSVPGSWEDARVKFSWQERFEAWDLYQQEKEDQIWDDRLNTLRERGWEYVELLLSKAEPMLKMPFVTQTIRSNDGGKITLNTVEAVDWNQYRIPLLMLQTAMHVGYQVIGDNNAALTLLMKKGFKIVDPTMTEDLSVYLEQDEQGINLDSLP